MGSSHSFWVAARRDHAPAERTSAGLCFPERASTIQPISGYYALLRVEGHVVRCNSARSAVCQSLRQRCHESVGFRERGNGKPLRLSGSASAVVSQAGRDAPSRTTSRQRAEYPTVGSCWLSCATGSGVLDLHSVFGCRFRLLEQEELSRTWKTRRRRRQRHLGLLTGGYTSDRGGLGPIS